MIRQRVARLFGLKARERHLLLEAYLLLGVVSPALKYGPDRWTGRVLQRVSGPAHGHADERLVSEIVTAVGRAARYVRAETCLARALVGWVMVTRRHAPAMVRLGVQRQGRNDFAAHAWLECNGQRVIGGEQAPGYTPFPSAP